MGKTHVNDAITEAALAAAGQASDVNTELFHEIGLDFGNDLKFIRGVRGTYVPDTSGEFAHVDDNWRRRCMPFLPFIGHLAEDHLTKEDWSCPESALRLRADLTLKDGTRPTLGGLKSLSSFTKIPARMVDYLYFGDTEDRGVLARQMNKALDRREREWADKKGAPRDFMLRFRRGSDGNKLVMRAVLSSGYARFDNVTAVEMLRDSIDQDGCEKSLLTAAWNSGDRISLGLLLPDSLKEDPFGDWGVVIRLVNSEVGDGVFQVYGSLYRLVDGSGIGWHERTSKARIRLIHRGKIDYDQVARDVRKSVDVALTHGNCLYTLLGYAREINVDDPVRAIAGAGRGVGLSQDQVRAAVEAYRKRAGQPGFTHTWYEVTMGLADYAASLEGEEKDAMEVLVGRLLTTKLDASEAELATHAMKLERQADFLDDGYLEELSALFAGVGETPPAR